MSLHDDPDTWPEGEDTSRARELAMDTHIVPHRHPWSQFTYCASGLMQVTVTQGERETTFIVPPSRAVWIAPQVQHNVVVLTTSQPRSRPSRKHQRQRIFSHFQTKML